MYHQEGRRHGRQPRRAAPHERRGPINVTGELARKQQRLHQYQNVKEEEHSPGIPRAEQDAGNPPLDSAGRKDQRRPYQEGGGQDQQQPSHEGIVLQFPASVTLFSLEGKIANVIVTDKVIRGWRLAIDESTDCRLPSDDWGLYLWRRSF